MWDLELELVEVDGKRLEGEVSEASIETVRLESHGARLTIKREEAEVVGTVVRQRHPLREEHLIGSLVQLQPRIPPCHKMPARPLLLLEEHIGHPYLIQLCGIQNHERPRLTHWILNPEVHPVHAQVQVHGEVLPELVDLGDGDDPEGGVDVQRHALQQRRHQLVVVRRQHVVGRLLDAGAGVAVLLRRQPEDGWRGISWGGLAGLCRYTYLV